jgi:predicted metalloprotease
MRRRRAGLATCVVAALLLGACGVEVGSSSGGAVGGTDVMGSPADATTAPSKTTTTLPPVDVTVVGDDGSPENDIARAAINDLQSWWAKTFPKLYGDAYEPVKGGFYAVDSSTDLTNVPCIQSYDDIAMNAFFCFDEDAVLWDQEKLLPDLAKQFGDFTVAVVLAHEWGHGIQVRAGTTDAPVVTGELQADCWAGAWTKHLRTDHVTSFDVSTDSLDQALAGVLSFHDTPGITPENTPDQAHGSGFDRVGAFQDGFEEGPQRCADYAPGDPKPYSFEFNDTQDAQAGGDMPLEDAGKDEGIESVGFRSLEQFWADEFPNISGGTDWKPLDDPQPFAPADPPTCDGDPVKDYTLFLCTPDNYVGFDTSAIPDVYDVNGDFGVATLFATTYGLAVQDQLGSDESDEVTVALRSDCYAGAWTAALVPTAADPKYELSLSPGDLDEAVGVLLSFRSEEDRKTQGIGFDRVRAFRSGVLKGAGSCRKVKPS